MVLDNFAVFEGIDGAGTTTQLSLVTERAAREGLSSRFEFTAEPAKTPVGIFIRSILSGNVSVEQGTLAYLFAADRYEHVYGKAGITQSLKEGKAVVSDRYVFSSLAYQSAQCGAELPKKLNEDFPLPEYLFFFELDIDTALERISARKDREIFETRAILTHTAREYERVISDYESLYSEMRSIGGGVPKTGGLRAGGGLAPSCKMNIIRINAADSIEKIHETIWSFIARMPIFTV
jgi:dTMP kinase